MCLAASVFCGQWNSPRGWSARIVLIAAHLEMSVAAGWEKRSQSKCWWPAINKWVALLDVEPHHLPGNGMRSQKRGAGASPRAKKGGGDIWRQKRPRTMRCNGIMEWQGRSCVMSLKVGLSLSKYFTHEQENKMYVLFEPGFNSESFVSGFSHTISILGELQFCFTVH